MGIGNILSALGTSGSITAPTTIPWSQGTALTPVLKDYGIYDWVFDPVLRAVFFGNGWQRNYHAIGAAIYQTGMLAPNAAQTLASTATRATAVLTTTGNFTNNDLIQVGRAGAPGNGYIYMKTTLDTTSTANQVLIGASAAASLQNIYDFINGTGDQGDKWWSSVMAFGGLDPAWDTQGGIEASAVAATTVTFRAVDYGTIGNAYTAREVVDGGGTYSFPGTVFSGGAVGTQTDANSSPGVGTYLYAYSHVRSVDGAQTAISDTATLQQGTNCDVNQTAFVDADSRDGATHFRWFRTTSGGNVYYPGEDVLIADAEPYVDDFSDSELTAHLPYDPSIFRPYASGYPENRRCVTFYKGCLFRGGILPVGTYDTGTASVTNGSVSVTLSATAIPKEDWIGLTFRVASYPSEYVIVDVTETAGAGVLTLNREYEEVTNAGASYTVTDNRDPFEIDYTPPLLPNNFPPDYSLTGVLSPDPTGIVAMQSGSDRLCVWTRTGLWSVRGDPESTFFLEHVGDGCGAYSPRSVVDVGGVKYWLGPDGVYGWSGGAINDLSAPPPEDGVVRGIAGTLDRINDDAVDGIVGDYNQSKSLIRWIVPLDGEPFNNYALVLDLQTGAFTLDRIPAATYIQSVIAPDGQYVTLLGDVGGQVFQLDVSNSDGAYGFETVATVTAYSATAMTVTCGAASFPTSGNGLKGVSLIHVDTSGNRQYLKVASNTGTVITLCWTPTTAIAVSDKIVVGAIEWNPVSSRFDYGLPDAKKSIAYATLDYIPASAGRLFLAAAIDNGTPSVSTRRSDSVVDYANLANADGEHLFVLRRAAGRRVQIEMLDLVPGHDLTVVGLVPWIPVDTEAVA